MNENQDITNDLNETSTVSQDEKSLLSVEKGSRANEQETIGNTSGINMLGRPPRQRGPVANPDDPLVQHPPKGPKGIWPGPNYLGLEGRTAIVQGQVFIVALILIAQLWMVTDALYELLSGRPDTLVWLALASFIGFVVALIIFFWPRRRIERS